ncbi:PDZ domain-containing protein [Sphingosinicella sp.]|uniref:PDZ domain-containing protein n=1 Tax=Sphingosinicella sp. TaxID=1917971 RepID=UPI0025F5EE61|nr:PDZ domain-containing protein [Sphingosinicella sp.]
MKRSFVAAACLIGASLADSAVALPRLAVTPSGLPEAVMRVATEEEARGKVASACMDKRMAVITNTPGQIVCEAPMNTGQQIATQLLLGNSYSTTPRQFLRVTFADVGDTVRAQAGGWVETQMAMGQMRQMPLDGDDDYNSLLGFLIEAGGTLPVGTTFPNAVWLGIEGDLGTDGRNGYRRVKSVTPDGPAAVAGMLPGDVITKLNGRPFKDEVTWFKRLGEPHKRPAHDIEIMRAGKAMVLSVPSRRRPAVTE